MRFIFVDGAEKLSGQLSGFKGSFRRACNREDVGFRASGCVEFMALHGSVYDFGCRALLVSISTPGRCTYFVGFGLPCLSFDHGLLNSIQRLSEGTIHQPTRLP